MNADLELPGAAERRAALLAEFDRPPRWARLRLGAPFLAAGALAATVAVVALVISLVPTGRPVSPATMSADLFARLDRLDDTVRPASRSYAPDNYVYVRTTAAETWISQSGAGRGAVIDARGLRTTDPPMSAAEARKPVTVAHVMAHPSLLGVLELQNGHRRVPAADLVRQQPPEDAFAAVRAMLRVGGLVPERTRTWLYRAAAHIPGVKVRTGVTDAAGRSGWALTLGRQVILFDPDDGSLLAEWSSGTPGPAVLADALVPWAAVRPAR